MNTGIFHDAAYSFETTLSQGENSIKEFMGVPENQVAFSQGDSTSYAALQNVIKKQKGLLENLEEIKRQLARAYHDQFTSSKSKNTSIDPDTILDLEKMMNMRDAAQDHITSTSRALKELARRIEVRDTSQSQQRPRSQQQQQPPPVFQAPYRSAPQPEFESLPDMPPRPAPQRPVRQPVTQPQSVPPSPMKPTSPTPNSNPNPPNPIALHSVGPNPGKYCPGALRLQRDNSLTIRDILRDAGGDTSAPLTCRYCNLKLGDDDFRDAVMQGQRKGTAIAKQHMMAYASLWDRKAMFKCFLCVNEEADSEFRDVEDFKAHLKCH